MIISLKEVQMVVVTQRNGMSHKPYIEASGESLYIDSPLYYGRHWLEEDLNWPGLYS